MPFGTALDAESSGFSNQVFTSYDRSASTGLDYAINRTYSRGQSRFTQVDPIGMAAANVTDPQSNNLFAYVQNMPTDFVDPSGLNEVDPTSRSPYGSDGCFSILIDGFFVGYWGNCGAGDRFYGGGGGSPQTQPQKPKKKRCKQDNKGGDADSIKEMQDRAGISDLIQNQVQSPTSPEGLLGYTRDRDALLARLAGNPAFYYNTGLGGLHSRDVGANNIDSRSRLWSGPPTLGRGTDGMVRSLQVVVGEPNSAGLTPVYSDLDCVNPAEGLLPLVIHGL